MHTVALVALNEFGIRLESAPNDWNDALPQGLSRPEQIEIFQRCHDREYIFLTNPYPGAVEALDWVSRSGYEVWYVSDRKADSHADTVEWLEKHGFPQTHNLHCSLDKRGLLEENKNRLATIIDDRPRTLIFGRYELGLDSVFTLRHEYNKNFTDVPGIHISEDWYGILDNLMEQFEGLKP